MTTCSIKVVTFDLDDTLWAVGPVILEAEKALWGWLKENCPQMAARYDRERLMPIRAAILEEQPGLEHDISALRIEILTRGLEASGFAPPAARENAEAAFEVFMHMRHKVDYFADVFSVLEQLKARFQLGAISNGNADVSRLEVGRYFEFASSAASVGISKPAPQPFEAALAAAECSPGQMVHVGDHHEHDVAGAQRLGIHTVWVNPTGKPFPGDKPASAEISSLSQLPDAVEALS